MTNKEFQMASRISQIVELKTNGKKTAFAEMMGWSKQYLNKLLNGESIGVNVISAIAAKFPDISLRWLLLGEGGMFEPLHMLNILNAWMQYEQFIPYMTAAERDQIQNGRTNFDQATIARWNKAKIAHDQAIESRFAAAYAHQENGN